MLTRKLFPQARIWFNLGRCKRCLSTTLVFKQSAVQQNGGDVTEKIKENLPTKRDPVPQSLLKRIKVEYHGVEPGKFNDETLWIPIFRFPYIGPCYATIRFKVYLTFVSFAACLRDLYCLLDSLNPSLLPSTILTSVTVIGMYITGNLFRQLVVQIYATEDLAHLRICRFTFFGKRRDMVLPLNAVVPLTESNRTRRTFFLKLETMRPEKISLDNDFHEFYDEKFKIVLKYGGVLDLAKFEKAFGQILRMKIASG